MRRDIFVSTSPRPEDMAALVKHLGHDGRVRHVRDEEYFAWRFGNPLSTYRFLYMFRGYLEAYLVLRMKMYADRGRAVELVDLEGETDKSLVQLLDIALRLGKLEPVTIWAPAITEARQEALRHLGFTELEDIPRSITENYTTILLRPTARNTPERPWLLGGRDLLDLASWDLRQLYSDGS